MGVGRRGLVEADGALLLKAISPMGRRALGLVLGLTRKPLDSTATTAGRLYEYSRHLQRSQSHKYRDRRAR